MDKNDGNRGSNYVDLMVFVSAGTQMVVSTFVGFGMGYWLDKRLGTQPILMIVFLLLGVAAGFLNIYRTVVRGTKSGNRPDNNR